MTSEAYPRWRFLLPFSRPPAWVHELTGIFTSNRMATDSKVEHAKRMESNDVLRVLADDMETKMGFTVERGKTRLGRLRVVHTSRLDNRPASGGGRPEMNGVRHHALPCPTMRV